MDEIILRFPHVSRSIYASLDTISLARCRTVNRLWNSFIDQEKFYWIELIVQLTQADKIWWTILKKSTLTTLTNFATHIRQFYKNRRNYGTLKNPLHFAAQMGEIDIVRNCYLLSRLDRNPKDVDNWTPLHFAARTKYIHMPNYYGTNAGTYLCGYVILKSQSSESAYLGI